MKLASPRAVAPALLLSVLVLAPFLNKAFTVDDTVFMREAVHALEDPLHPTAFDMVWRHAPERVSQHVPTGPVMAWLLVPSAAAGGAEWLAHAMQLAMLAVAALATVALARRLGFGYGAVAALLVVGAPAVLAMAGTAMPDVPAMALGVAGLERLVSFGQDRRPSQAVLAAALLGLAALTRSHAVLLLGIGALLLLSAARSASSWRERLVLGAPLLGAAAVVVATMLVTADPEHGAGGMVGAAVFYSSLSMKQVAGNVVALPIHWVLAMGFALPWVALRWRRMLRSRAVLAALGAGVALSAAALAVVERPLWPLAVIGGIGVAVLFDPLVEAWRSRDAVGLALALWLLVGVAALTYAHLPAKYLVLSAPAAALLVARELAARSGRAPWVVLGVALAADVALGVAILRADAAHGELGRRAAAQWIAPRVAAGQRVWFVGHWGFQWYAEAAGGRHATLTPPYPERGDLLVVSLASARSEKVLDMLAQRYPRMAQVGEIVDAAPGGRIMNKKRDIGFYSNVSGFWPWGWGDSSIDVFLAFVL